LFFIGSPVVRNVSVVYSDTEATAFTALVTSSDAPGTVQASVSHVLDNRLASFPIRNTGRQTATCLQNCVALALQGSSSPLLVRLQYFSLVTRSNQLRCSVSSSSSCSLQLLNASSTVTYIQIAIGSFGSSTQFQLGAFSAVVTVFVNDDSASFGFNFLSSPSVKSDNFMTETSFQLSFDQNIMFNDDTIASCDLFRNYVALFGRDATCRVSRRQTLTVEGGPSFSLYPGDTVTIIPGLLFGSAQVAHSLTASGDSASGDFAVLAPVRSQLPRCHQPIFCRPM